MANPYRFTGADLLELESMQPDLYIDIADYGFKARFALSVELDGEQYRNGMVFDFDPPDEADAARVRARYDSFPARKDFLTWLATNAASKLNDWKTSVIARKEESGNG